MSRLRSRRPVRGEVLGLPGLKQRDHRIRHCGQAIPSVITSVITLPLIPISDRSASERLVRTVTARTIGFEGDCAAASTAALSILLPPEAWTVSMLTPSSAAALTAAANGVGNVVELQVQKDFTAGGDEIANDLRGPRP